MDPVTLVQSLEQFPAMLRAAVHGLPDEAVRWRPSDGAWSVLEIVCHLADEETDDFRTRLRMTLEDPQQIWPPIDPERAAIDRKYRDADFELALERFVHERRQSLQWLHSLEAPNWETVYDHPRGPITTGDLLASWAAHDMLHLRQITKRRIELIQHAGEPYSTLYAGQW